jgi:predicted nucleic acid-binding protein
MNLDDIPAGSLCVIDTNVLLYAEQGASLQAQRLLRRIERQDVLGVLPQPVWQELTHKLKGSKGVGSLFLNDNFGHAVEGKSNS